MRQFILKTVVLVVAIAMSITSYSKSWRVNDDVNQKAKFLDINAAMNSDEVDDGDTLYLDPGCTLGAAQEVIKAVTIIGTGYFFENIPYNEAYISGNLTLSAQNCKVEGLHCEWVSINEPNVTLERCRMSYIFGNSKSNVTIRSCYVEGTSNSTLVNGGANWIIENCILKDMYTGSSSYTISNLSSSIIRNNYIYCKEYNSYYGRIGYCLNNLTRCDITNNIILNNVASPSIRDLSNCTVTNNIFGVSAISEYPNNIYDASESTVFALSGNNDRRYQLSRNSPAKGYATDGGDCGPYGSGYSYVPSGMPFGHPYFTEVQVGSVTKENKLKATYKVSIQDE